jgi:hypothetical protein
VDAEAEAVLATFTLHRIRPRRDVRERANAVVRHAGQRGESHKVVVEIDGGVVVVSLVDLGRREVGLEPAARPQ